MKNFLILHNIRSAYNVGSIFRTADACGIYKIFLTGYTPTPLDNFGREVKTISKTALGAEKDIEWEYHHQVGRLIKKLKKEGVEIIAVEQDDDSVDYKKITVENSTAFIFGNEVRGISKQLLEQCDRITEVKMKGKKESLNVSVAVGVVLFRILNI